MQKVQYSSNKRKQFLEVEPQAVRILLVLLDLNVLPPSVHLKPGLRTIACTIFFCLFKLT